MDKLKMQSVDGCAAQFDIIARHFPHCITVVRNPSGDIERVIDFDRLKADLAPVSAPAGVERYQFTWPGKADAARLANFPTTATLRPCREESVDFDTTQNLYIEGDNLEVLKVLRNTCAGKVKMIYIDPPYNTGNDFVYEDDFAIDADDYLLRSGQMGADGQRLVVNSDSNGRFHTDWLNMIYPRLKVAREFLSDDGVIFISIDDYEADNMRKVCNEIFGESNFVAQFVWQRAFSPKNDARYVSASHDYILMYAKNLGKFTIGRLPRTEKHNARYRNLDNDPRGPWAASDLSVKTYNPEYDYEITTPSGRKVTPPSGRCWGVSKKRFEELVSDNRIWFGEKGSNSPTKKTFLSELKKEGIVPQTMLLHKDYGSSRDGGDELRQVMGVRVFDGPKPTSLIRHLMVMANLADDSTVLDFFSGSGTTAHAVMKANADTGKHCSFICVQIPEVVNDKSAAANEGYSTICEIGRERIRRAGAAIRDEAGLTAGDAAGPAGVEAAGELDTGFRVLRLDSSNMKDVFYSPDEVRLGGFSEFNIKEDRSGEDLLFQVMLELGVELSSTIEVKNLADHKVYVVSQGSLKGYLAACFDERVSLEAARAIADLKPHWFVMCDSAFGSDADADNLRQLFAGCSGATQIKVI